MKRVFLTIILVAGMAVVAKDLLPSQQKSMRMYRAVRAGARRTRREILDIYFE